MMREGKLLTFLRILFQEQVYEVRKNGNKTLEISIWAKNCKLIFLNMRSCARAKKKVCNVRNVSVGTKKDQFGGLVVRTVTFEKETKVLIEN